MKKVVLALFLALASFAVCEEASLVQFARGLHGKTVTVCIDGAKVETTFAGKLFFKDQSSSWLSVCGNVRKQIGNGQMFYVQPYNTSTYIGNIRKAGNIVAKYFNEAQTPEQCAGLQIAVWEALEDGGSSPDFFSGKFQVQADPASIVYAEHYYTAVNTPGQATMLQSTSGMAQSQIIPQVVAPIT